ncbi:hypothetical protein A4A49_59317, partial [Nicotiana attenuata]
GDSGPGPPTLCHKLAPVELGRFRGENPDAWIFQAERYFKFYGITENHKLPLGSFYLDGEALEWPQGHLSKIRQLTTVSEYQSMFEAIANKANDIKESLMVHLFCSGLKEYIKTSVLIHEPTTIYKPSLKSLNLILAALSHLNSIRIPFKRLTPAEIQSHRERGICCYCDEKYSSTHKCKNLPQLLLLIDGSEIKSFLPEPIIFDDISADELQCLEIQEHSAILYHALSGGNSPTTLRFTGHVNGSPVQVLIGGGNTANFVQTRVAKFLQLTIEPIPHFPVVMGSRHRLWCEGVSRKVPLSIQRCDIFLDLYVLSLHGSNMVLGVSWLSILGLVVTDYATHLFEFSHQGKTINWEGEALTDAQPVQLHSIRRYVATYAISSYFYLQVVPSESSPTDEIPPDLIS